VCVDLCLKACEERTTTFSMIDGEIQFDSLFGASLRGSIFAVTLENPVVA
jgi:hypothetical protein